MEEFVSYSDRITLRAIFSDLLNELDLVKNSVNTGVLGATAVPYVSKLGDSTNQDALLQALNRAFFDTFIRFEKCRPEDYIELPSGAFRKLNNEESCSRTFLEETSQLNNCIKIMLAEIEESGTFTALQDLCKQKQKNADALENFAILLDKTELEVKAIKFNIDTIQHEYKSKYDLYRNVLRKLKNEFQEASQMVTMSKDYIIEIYQQCYYKCFNSYEMEAKIVSNCCMKLRERIINETRNFSDSLNWSNMNIDDKHNFLHYLGSNDDIVNFKKQLSKLTNDYTKVKSEHNKIKQDYASCKIVVEEVNSVQEKKRMLKEFYTQYMIAMLQIQSWWRCMIEIKNIKIANRRERNKKQAKKTKK